MEKLLNTKTLPWVILAAGILGFILELLLNSFGGTFLYALVWLLTASTAALLVWRTWDLKQAPKYSFNFPASAVGAAGAAAAAAGRKLLTAGVPAVLPHSPGTGRREPHQRA